MWGWKPASSEKPKHNQLIFIFGWRPSKRASFHLFQTKKDWKSLSPSLFLLVCLFSPIPVSSVLSFTNSCQTVTGSTPWSKISCLNRGPEFHSMTPYPKIAISRLAYQIANPTTRWIWESYSASLCLSFLVFKMRSLGREVAGLVDSLPSVHESWVQSQNQNAVNQSNTCDPSTRRRDRRSRFLGHPQRPSWDI